MSFICICYRLMLWSCTFIPTLISLEAIFAATFSIVVFFPTMVLEKSARKARPEPAGVSLSNTRALLRASRAPGAAFYTPDAIGGGGAGGGARAREDEHCCSAPPFWRKSGNIVKYQSVVVFTNL